jgi:hypothetical protein
MEWVPALPPLLIYNFQLEFLVAAGAGYGVSPLVQPT